MPSANQYLQYLQLPQVGAFLDTIAYAEGANYNTLFGGGSFSNYSQHPNQAITAGGYTSTAAGRYQFLHNTWKGIANKLGLSDFSPTNQDIAALELINQRQGMSYLLNGDVIGILQHLGCAWASLPFSGCGQSEKTVGQITNYFDNSLAARGGNIVPISANLSDSQGLLDSVNSEDNTALYVLLGLGALILLT